MVALIALGCARPPAGSDSAGSAPHPISTSPTQPAPGFCATERFGREVPWDSAGPYGLHRHDLAEDFAVEVVGEDAEWRLSERWTGCESVVFLVDPPVDDLAGLIDASPENVHWFLAASEKRDVDELADARDDVIRALGRDREAWWGERVHVAADPVDKWNDWVEDELLSDVGRGGFAIDRAQRIRGLGSLADVFRYDGSASWPWLDNLAYAAYEVELYNQEAERQEALDAEVEPVLVPVFRGEVLSQYAEADVALPALDAFDTFEVELEMRCPDPDRVEFGNCGAWDYLAGLSVQGDDGGWIELARFITAYHREAHWVVDATPWMPLLGGGGARRIRWEWAPYWNVQPTSTFLTLRFADRGRGRRPIAATNVATGGAFGSTYNDGRVPVDVPIPADASATELVVVVSGHGAGTNSCSEFCDHQHEFTVGGSEYGVEFPEAGTSSGCRDAGVDEQMTPNQWGTWWFGRGGWCPGQPVVPHVFDVSADATPGGSLSVAYRGLYRDATPPDGSGDIVLNAWIVTYR